MCSLTHGADTPPLREAFRPGPPTNTVFVQDAGQELYQYSDKQSLQGFRSFAPRPITTAPPASSGTPGRAAGACLQPHFPRLQHSVTHDTDRKRILGEGTSGEQRAETWPKNSRSLGPDSKQHYKKSLNSLQPYRDKIASTSATFRHCAKMSRISKRHTSTISAHTTRPTIHAPPAEYSLTKQDQLKPMRFTFTALDTGGFTQKRQHRPLMK